MENGKWETENKKRLREGEELHIIRYLLPVKTLCSACGEKARRENARFCAVCGKLLGEDYQPLDNLRASYRLQGKSFLVDNAGTEEITSLFPKNQNSVSETAWACLVYSFVPYLGILFVPLAFVAGLFGVAISIQKANSGSRKLAVVCVALSFVVLAIQIFLWWLLYFIPEIGKQI